MTDSIKTATTKPESLRANLSPQQGVFPRPASSVPSASSHLMTLHRTLGNQAVGRLIRQSGVGCRESGVIQAKLTINNPNDIYEQEADQVAEQVIRMPDKGDDGNKIDSTCRISQSEIGNPQSAIQLKPG